MKGNALHGVQGRRPWVLATTTWHDDLATVPLMAVRFIGALHWTQVQGLFRIGGRRPDWSIRLKCRPLPWGYMTGLLAALIALEVGPWTSWSSGCARRRNGGAGGGRPALLPDVAA